MKAKAVVFTGKREVEVREIDVPELAEDQVLIDVTYSWISIGTESSFLKQERIAGDAAYKPGDPPPFPQVPGYQKVGVVRALGSNVNGLEIGDNVFATVSEVEGMMFPYGGHVSPAVTYVSQVWKLPEGASPIAYSGMVLAQVGYNCGIKPPVQPGDLAVVIGDGLVGHWAAQTLLQRGANVIVLGRHDKRLSLLPDGVRGINTRHIDISDGLGSQEHNVQIVVDTVAAMDTFEAIRPLMKHGSHLVSAGFHGENGYIHIPTIRGQEITLHCPSGWEKTRMDAALRGIHEGWLQTEPLITHIVDVAQARDVWDMILNKQEFCLGVVLKW
ncbi:alcohol dehydrogenase catalytic domain-containing protein [Cohnella silvisoli]|uniref:Alcohol dehydrogenase-like N-terminal domain-containing protein n=1 Tax=Cohnella silvisoli TaxID=2873699 RepID=A0ABV1KLA4_9BACL|nr:hypothetical protein [Cohnella silvisoli]MCD9020751.1 hypothetical protein [Cohnella silvisoli]